MTHRPARRRTCVSNATTANPKKENYDHHQILDCVRVLERRLDGPVDRCRGLHGSIDGSGRPVEPESVGDCSDARRPTRHAFFERPPKSAGVKFANNALIVLPFITFDKQAQVQPFREVDRDCAPIIPYRTPPRRGRTRPESFSRTKPRKQETRITFLNSL